MPAESASFCVDEWRDKDVRRSSSACVSAAVAATAAKLAANTVGCHPLDASAMEARDALSSRTQVGCQPLWLCSRQNGGGGSAEEKDEAEGRVMGS